MEIWARDCVCIKKKLSYVQQQLLNNSVILRTQPVFIKRQMFNLFFMNIRHFSNLYSSDNYNDDDEDDDDQK